MCGLRCEEKIVPKKTVCTAVNKYKEHGTIGRLQGSRKLLKFTTEVPMEANMPKMVTNEQGLGILVGISMV